MNSAWSTSLSTRNRIWCLCSRVARQSIYTCRDTHSRGMHFLLKLQAIWQTRTKHQHIVYRINYDFMRIFYQWFKMSRHKTVAPVVLIASWAYPRHMMDASLACIHAARRSRATAGKPYKRLLCFLQKLLSQKPRSAHPLHPPQNMSAVGVSC